MSDEKKEEAEAEVPAVEEPVYSGPNTSRSPVEPPVDASTGLFPMAESLEGLADDLREQFGEAVLGDKVYRGDLTVLITNEKFFEVCKYLRDTPKWAFNFCVDVTAIDYLLMGETPRFENVAHLYSIEHCHRVRVKCPIEEEDMKCASLVPLYPGANYMERETYDMYGIDYQEHPDLTRILLADGWEGYPLRKDFPVGGVPSFYFKTDTNPRAGEPADLVPRIREQTTDV